MGTMMATRTDCDWTARELNALYLLTASWAVLCPNGRAGAIEIARQAARQWADARRDRFGADDVISSAEFVAYLQATFGETGFRRWYHQEGWTEDEDDQRVCAFCVELETVRRVRHGLPPIPQCHNSLRMALELAEERFRAVEGTGGDGHALKAALLARMLLNAATGETTPSEVYECRACPSDETEVPWEVENELCELGGILGCRPEQALHRAIAVLRRLG